MDMNCWCIVCGRWCQTSADMRLHKAQTNHLGFLRAQPTDQYTCRECDLLLPSIAAVVDHVSISSHGFVRKLSADQVAALKSIALDESDSYIVLTEEQKSAETTEASLPSVAAEAEERYDCCNCGQHFINFDLVNAHTAETGHEKFVKTTILPPSESATPDETATVSSETKSPPSPPPPPPQPSIQNSLYRLPTLPPTPPSPYPERSTQLSVCTQCGKWFATDAVRIEHCNFTGHQLYLPVKEKGARTAYKCLDCSQLLRSANQVAQHQWEYGHDQFATLCENRPLGSGTAVGGSGGGSGTRSGEQGGDGMLDGGGNTAASRKEVGYFECNECSARLARSSDLPAHHSKTGHQKFSRLQPCSTGIAVETWNHSGRMVRGQVISSLSEASRGLGMVGGIANGQLCSSHSGLAASGAVLGNSVASPSSMPSNSSLSRRLALPLLPVCVVLCQPSTFRTAVLVVSRHDAAEVDELVERLRTLVAAGYNLEESVYHCTLCPRRCHNYNVMLDHGKLCHQVSEDLLEKGVLYMTIEIEQLELRVKYSCLLCSVEHTDREALWHHISVEHSRNCPICREAVAKLPNAMRNHMKTSGCVNRCIDCGAAMESAWNLKRHRETACPAMGKTRTHGSLSGGRKRRHLAANSGGGRNSRSEPHSGSLTIPAMASDMDGIVVDQDEADEQEEEVEEEELIFQCKHCSREFTDLARVKEHRYQCIKRPKHH